MKKMHLLLLLALALHTAHAQRRSKTPAPAAVTQVPLTLGSFDGWQAVGTRQLTPDGRWAVYSVGPQEGDGHAVFRQLPMGRTDSVQRAALLQTAYDGRHVAFAIRPQTGAVRQAKRLKKKKEEMPRDSLGIYDLATGTLWKTPGVLNFKMPEKAGGVVAYQTDPAPAPKDTTAARKKAPKPPRKFSEENGYPLVLRHLTDGTERTFAYATEYALAKNGSRLAYVSTGNDSTDRLPGVYVVDVPTGRRTKIYEAKGKQKRLTFDERGEQLAFLTDADTNAKSLVHYHQLRYWRAGQPQARLLADTTSQPGPKGWVVSGDAPLTFAEDGSKLFFGTAPKAAVPDTTLLPEEVVSVEIWGPTDARLQTQQKATLEQDRKRAYTAVAHLPEGRVVQLSTLEVPEVEPINRGRAEAVLGISREKYTNRHWDWNPRQDAYLISTRDGSRRLIGTGIQGDVNVSPEGKYAYWFSLPDTAWVVWSARTGQTLRMTRPAFFADEDDDHPDYRRAYGVAGWTKGDAALWVYDKFDIWALDPETAATTNLTRSGRTAQREYRYLRLDPEARWIDDTQPLLLRHFDHTTKRGGFSQWAGGQVKPLLEGDFNVQPGVVKARQAPTLLFQETAFRQFPELLVSDLTFRQVQPLTALDRQLAAYKWGTAELVRFTNGNGVPLQGLLYKPADFDSTKKYPMLVYFYEKNADNLYNFSTPSPAGGGSVNYAYAASNGYVVFVPDIVYEIGHPGMSAYRCIVPGVLSIISRGFVDKARIGTVGHSWGGYQTSFLITQTDLFRAAVPGAPVANMTSAYGGIRWGTGMSRQAQYEATQSRIGGSLWQKPLQYIENSPLFFADRVTTPTLILHNDDDDAVPWYQGIEFYMALKRLGKPVWMVNYNGEKHGLRQRKNQEDWTRRMWQFLDHYLKDAPAPRWMTDGLPMVEKGVNQRFEPAPTPIGGR